MARQSSKTTDLIERTSKPLKLQLALSSMLLLGGIVILFAWREPMGVLSGIFSAVIGFIWQLITRVRIWWNHG